MALQDWAIGDLARYGDEICKITQLRATIASVSMNRYEGLVSIDALHPIPLAEKIFATNGFDVGWQTYVTKYPYGDLIVEYIDTKNIYRALIKDSGDICIIGTIHYVHELQHILSVLNCNKEIVL